ncbi:oxygenase MpaB family protein [Erythrobacter sp. HKB08]|uniref:oxygenase MpaB family protein n=1 Tax=Erythrobacter sp. HKB08 TaxID=2502843 RepID=UPI001008D38A|nr:oxygenase MpaB family protein [Erythrobacter sp. HKB08]
MASLRPSERVRQRLVERVRAVFNDVEGGEQPVPVSDEALFEKDSPIRLVHADVVSMMIGGVRGLLLQMLHPHALQGVLDHSNFRADMHGRLRRTARFIAVTTFGHHEEAAKAIERVNAIHSQVSGTLPDGSQYSATNPRTLAWVHVAEATSFLEAYLRYVRPSMPFADQDEYYRQFAEIARRLGADPVPETKNEAEKLLREMRGELVARAEAKEVANLVLNQRPQGAPPGVQAAIGTAAVDLLPVWARDMLDLREPGLAALPAKFAAQSVGRTLRWAFRQ